MKSRTYYIGCFVPTSDYTSLFEVRWIGTHYEMAVRLLDTVLKKHLLLDDYMIHYLLTDDDVTMDWSRVKEVRGNA